jgi:hypothetical protein
MMNRGIFYVPAKKLGTLDKHRLIPLRRFSSHFDFEFVHFASRFSCKIARFEFQSPLTFLYNYLNLLLLKPIF